MVEVRHVEHDRYEVFAQDRHWEAFIDLDRALQEAERLAREIGVESGASPVAVQLVVSVDGDLA